MRLLSSPRSRGSSACAFIFLGARGGVVPSGPALLAALAPLLVLRPLARHLLFQLLPPRLRHGDQLGAIPAVQVHLLEQLDVVAAEAHRLAARLARLHAQLLQ